MTEFGHGLTPHSPCGEAGREGICVSKLFCSTLRACSPVVRPIAALAMLLLLLLVAAGRFAVVAGAAPAPAPPCSAAGAGLDAMFTEYVCYCCAVPMWMMFEGETEMSEIIILRVFVV